MKKVKSEGKGKTNSSAVKEEVVKLSEDAFEIHFEYEGRTGITDYNTPSYRKFAYKNCKLIRAPNGRITKITTKFKSHKSEGDVEFIKLRQ